MIAKIRLMALLGALLTAVPVVTGSEEVIT